MRAAREAERRRGQWRRFCIRRSTPRGRATPRLPTHPRLLWQHVELRQRLELVLAGLIHEVLVRRLWARRQRLDPSPVARHHDVLRLGLVVLEPHDLALCDRRGREQPAPVLAALGVVAHDHRRVEHHRRPRRSGARQGSPPKPFSTRIPSLAPRPGRGGAAPGALSTARAVATISHPSGNAPPQWAAAAGRWARQETSKSAARARWHAAAEKKKKKNASILTGRPSPSGGSGRPHPNRDARARGRPDRKCLADAVKTAHVQTLSPPPAPPVFIIFIFILNPRFKCMRSHDARLRSHLHTKGSFYFFLFLKSKG